jgi:cysteinyl-tRNA synthetase
LRDALCDDLNTASAFAVLSDLARKAKVNSHDAQQLVYCAEFLGLNTKHWFSNSDVTEAMADRDPAWVNTITSLIEARIEARRARNFADSDRLRDELVAMGIQLKDSKDAEGNPTTTWEVMR